MSLTNSINNAKTSNELLGVFEKLELFLDANKLEIPSESNNAIAIQYLKLFIKQKEISPIYESKLEKVFSTLLEIEKGLKQKGIFFNKNQQQKTEAEEKAFSIYGYEGKLLSQNDVYLKTLNVLEELNLASRDTSTDTWNIKVDVMFSDDSISPYPHFSSKMNSMLENPHIELVHHMPDNTYSVKELVGDENDIVIDVKNEKDFKTYEGALRNYIKRSLGKNLELYSIHARIQNNEEVPSSEFSKIDFESEAFNSLDDSVKETITNYVNERSDTINADALEKDKQQSASTDLNV